MKIKIVSIEFHDATTKKGQPYQVVEVAYKNLTYQGKMESRKIMPFGTTEGTHKVLSKAAVGQFYEVEVVKNAAGFNDWVSATPSVDGEAVPGPVASPVGKPTTRPVASTSSGSTYSTAEERAKTQVYIVRQHSITSALAYLANTSANGATVDDVLEIARKFEQHVFSIAKPKNLADMDDDLPPAEAYNDDIPY